MVEHLGSRASSGHYLCYVRMGYPNPSPSPSPNPNANPNPYLNQVRMGEQWFKMSDVRAHVVGGRSRRDGDSRSRRNRRRRRRSSSSSSSSSTSTSTSTSMA